MYQKFPVRLLSRYMVATVIVICLLPALTISVLAAAVNIYDQARVFQNTALISNEAKSLPYPVDIYTTNTFNGSSADFDNRALSHVDNPNKIVIAIDTVHRHLSIVGGRSVSLSSGQYHDAVSAFSSNFNGGDYTGATIAAIRSLRYSAGSSSGSGGALPVPTGSGGGLGFGTLCCVSLLILAAIAFFAIMRRRRGGRGYNQPYNPPYGQPHDQPHPPSYGPGPYQQGQGMNPWAAGGLGAAAGGLAGYELGRRQGEEERGQGGNYGGDDFGGGASGDFGGGSSGDFGGGGSGDFGGGSSGDFGGGGNSGGGSSGNF